MRKFDIFFVVVIAICAVVSLAACTYDAPVDVETEETTKPITIVVEKETEPKKVPVTLYDVPLDEELQCYIVTVANSYGVEPSVIFAMAFYESTYNPKATNGGGYTLGLLQVQPRWHKKRMERLNCSDLLDPYQNVAVAVDYLAEQIDRYDDLAKGITAYNKGHYAGEITYYAKAVMNKAEEIKETAYVSYR